MARGGSDDYNPIPTVSPSVGPEGLDTAKSSPADFGAQVGGALENAGQKVSQVGDEAAQVALKQQGMINEAVQTDAETTYITSASQLQADYRSKEGLQAVAAYPQYAKDVAALRQQISGTLNNPAQVRGFDLLARRHEANFISDGSLYQASQIKAADSASANASMGVAVSRTSDFDVASNPARFKDAIQDADFGINRIIAGKGYGADSGSGVKQNSDGTLSFDTATVQGQQANSVYQDYRNKNIGQAYKNATQALANDPARGNINLAEKFYQDHKAEMPPETQAELGAWLQPRVRAAQAHTVADNIIAGANGAYQGNLSSGNTTGAAVETSILKALPGASFTSRKRTPEENAAVGGVANSAHLEDRARDLIPPPNMSLEDAADKIRQANPVLKVVVEGPGATHSTGPHIHVEWPAGTQTQPSGTKTFQSQADYYAEHYDDFLSQSDAEAERLHPGDQVYADQQRARVTQRLDSSIHQQSVAYKADADTVYGALKGQGGNLPPASEDELRAVPGAGDAYDRMWVNTPQAAEHIKNILTANANGKASAYGQDFYTSLRSVLAPTTDPSYVHDQNKFLGKVAPGNNGPLSNTGFHVLGDMLNTRGTPKGEAMASQTRNFLDAMHSEMTFTNESAGVIDTKGEDLFNNWLMHSMPAILQGSKDGNMAPLTDPKSPSYIGNVKLRSAGEIQNDILEAEPQPKIATHHVTPLTAADMTMQMNAVKTEGERQDLLKRAMKEGRLSRADADQIAIAKGYIRAPAPSVPSAHE